MNSTMNTDLEAVAGATVRIIQALREEGWPVDATFDLNTIITSYLEEIKDDALLHKLLVSIFTKHQHSEDDRLHHTNSRMVDSPMIDDEPVSPSAYIPQLQQRFGQKSHDRMTPDNADCPVKSTDEGDVLSSQGS